MSQPTIPTQTPASKIDVLKKFVSKIKYSLQGLRLLELLLNIGRGVISFITSFPGLVSLFWVSLISISLVGFLTESTRLLSFAGLAWMSVWLTIFAFSTLTHERLEKFSYRIEHFLQDSELHAAFLVFIHIFKWLLLIISKWAFTIAGISICFAHALTSLHIWTAQGKLYELLNFQELSLTSKIILILPPIIGFVSDLRNRLSQSRQRGKGVYAFGAFEFYRGTILLFSGLIGGKPGIMASHSIFGRPFGWFINDWFNISYSESIAYQVYQSLGIFFFLFFYMFIPLTFAVSAIPDIKNYRYRSVNETPLSTLSVFLVFSAFLLLISGYVSWHEGWITMIAKWVLTIIGIIVKFIIFLYNTVSGFFS